MPNRLIRTYKSLDVQHIQKHLLIHGALSSSCGNCQAINLKLETNLCPQCHTEIKYIAFQNTGQHLPKLVKINEQRPSVQIIDYDDFKKSIGEIKAKEFLR